MDKSLSLTLLCGLFLFFTKGNAQRLKAKPQETFPTEGESAKIVRDSPKSTPIRGSTPSFRCPEPFGIFEDPYQCDKYWECDNKVATPRLCDDGLVFDSYKAHVMDPCDSPFAVDCKGRSELQEPSFASEYCPRRNGFFADPDPTVCDVFYTCIKGINKEHTKCPPDLHFDELRGICTWPAEAGRSNCVEKRQSIDGFTCPLGMVRNSHGVHIPHPSYPNPKDCQKFYTCLGGKLPQRGSCGLGKVFNDRSRTCDFPENVPDCDPALADYYYYDEPVSDSAAGTGKQDTLA